MGAMHKTDAVPPSVQQIVDAIVSCEASGDELREMIVSALAAAERKGAEQMRVAADRDCVSHMMVVAGQAYETETRKAGHSWKSIRRAICTAIAQDKNLRKKLSASAAADARREGSEARSQSSAWQPIETAPKDTEVFIGAFIDEEFHFGRSVLFYEQGNAFEGEAWRGWVWSIDDCSESVAESPTHWMPIPAAPSRT